MSKLPRSEVAANVAVCCIAAILLIVVWRSFVKSSPEVPQKLTANVYKVGDAFDLPVDVSFQDAPMTVMLVLESQCHFCEESLPFWKRLARKRASLKDRFRIVGLSMNPVEIGRAYLEESGLAVDAVERYPLERLDRLSGTPTVWVIDRSKRVLGVWSGKLDARQEAAVEKLVGVN